MSVITKVRALLIATSAVFAAAAMPTVAGAATVSDRTTSLDGGSSSALVVSDAATQANRFKVTVDGRWVTIQDALPISETSNSCWIYNSTTVVCNADPSVAVDVRAGNGNDSISLVNLTPSGSRGLWAYGGAGADALYGSAGADLLAGDGDNDYLFGGAGKDSFIGGAGNDSFDARDGVAEVVSGDIGCDTARLDDSDRTYSMESGTTPTLGWANRC